MATRSPREANLLGFLTIILTLLYNKTHENKLEMEGKKCCRNALLPKKHVSLIILSIKL